MGDRQLALVTGGTAECYRRLATIKKSQRVPEKYGNSAARSTRRAQLFSQNLLAILFRVCHDGIYSFLPKTRLSKGLTMRKCLLAIGFTLAGILTSQTQAQVISLTFDPAQSSADVSIAGDTSTSSLSGTGEIDIQNLGPPSGNAQITQLDVALDDGLDFSIGIGIFSVSASSEPGDVTFTLVTPGAPGMLSGSSFDQLGNEVVIDGVIDVSDPFGLAGGDQTIDLSTLAGSAFDSTGINVSQSGDVITVSGTFAITQMLDGLGAVDVDVTYVATGVVPVVTVLLGDVNLDGFVTFLDIAPFISILSGLGFQDEADIDQNGAVDFLDIAPFIGVLSGQSP